MNQLDPKPVALAFVNQINAGDIEGIAALMTEGHEFIDIPGACQLGRENMRAAWNAYFRLFPDYRIHVESVSVAGLVVVLRGRSTGTLSPHGREALRRSDGSFPPDEELQGAAIWTALVQGDQVAQWRVYADTSETRVALGISTT